MRQKVIDRLNTLRKELQAEGEDFNEDLLSFILPVNIAHLSDEELIELLETYGVFEG